MCIYFSRIFTNFVFFLTVCVGVSTPPVAMGHGAAQVAPDFYSVTASANYRPVDRPGMQRRVAQTDAEDKARKQIYQYVGSMRLADGRTVNDVLATDARLKARVQELVRTSETYEWAVSPATACVQVWVRLDLNHVRAVLRQCGY